jgi:ribokinase
MAKPEIVVVGSFNMDMVLKLEKLPAPGETIIGGSFLMADGGKGANQAVAAARLGAEVTFVARVGADMFGRQAIQDLQKEGINTDYIVADDTDPSGVALIFVDRGGENSIGVASGANDKLSEVDIDAAKAKVINARVMILQLETPLPVVRHAARLAADAGVKVILNPAPAQKLDEPLLRDLTVLTPNEGEAELLTGVQVRDEMSASRAAQSLRVGGVDTVVITMGAKGSFLATRDREELVPTKEITPLDTTAAGDAFNGALALALAEGADWLEAVDFANGAGALTATRMGAQPSLPTADELQRFRRD